MLTEIYNTLLWTLKVVECFFKQFYHCLNMDKHMALSPTGFSLPPQMILLKKKEKTLYIGIKADTQINGTLKSPEKPHTDMDN